jgi:hypothetical protein
MDANGDMTFGSSQQNFLVNSPEAVGQLVLTRLKLIQGEWFLDTTAGVPWKTQILGRNTGSTYDQAIKACILGTPGVTSIASYSSSLVNRKLTVTATINTAYGLTTITTTL